MSADAVHIVLATFGGALLIGFGFGVGFTFAQACASHLLRRGWP